MSRKDKSKPLPSEGKAGHSPGVIDKLRFFYPVLASCILERNEPPEHADLASAERFYDSAIRPIDRTSEGLNAAVCDFSAGKKIGDTKILEIQATYFIAFAAGDVAMSHAEEQQLVEQIAGAAAWPLFRDLFIHIGSQSGDELPLLPNVPKLRWLKRDEEPAED